MSPWIGNIIYVACVAASIWIRVPHDKKSQETKVAESRKGTVEKILLALMMISMVILPVLSFTPILAFVAYDPNPSAVALGTVVMLVSLWLFHRSHTDLGKNWSMTLEVREGHALITGGVYNRIRHPMYTSIFLMAIGQLLLLSNWIAGPSMLAAFTLMFASRLNTEEKMMLDKFGAEYEAYRKRSKRIIPGVW